MPMRLLSPHLCDTLSFKTVYFSTLIGQNECVRVSMSASVPCEERGSDTQGKLEVANW